MSFNQSPEQKSHPRDERRMLPQLQSKGSKYLLTAVTNNENCFPWIISLFKTNSIFAAMYIKTDNSILNVLLFFHRFRLKLWSTLGKEIIYSSFISGLGMRSRSCCAREYEHPAWRLTEMCWHNIFPASIEKFQTMSRVSFFYWSIINRVFFKVCFN